MVAPIRNDTAAPSKGHSRDVRRQSAAMFATPARSRFARAKRPRASHGGGQAKQRYATATSRSDGRGIAAAKIRTDWRWLRNDRKDGRWPSDEPMGYGKATTGNTRKGEANLAMRRQWPAQRSCGIGMLGHARANRRRATDERSTGKRRTQRQWRQWAATAETALDESQRRS